VGSRLDQHFGGDAWRGRLVPYIAQCGSAARLPNEKIDAAHHQDAFGTVWRTDELPSSVVEPGLKAPSFQGYAFPAAKTFMDVTANVKQRVGESFRSFTIILTSLCLVPAKPLRVETPTENAVAVVEEFLDNGDV